MTTKAKVRAVDLKKALAKKHKDDFFLTEVKNGDSIGINKRPVIMDAVAIKKSWTKPNITAYEIKTSRSDFLNDTKYPNYMELCHSFYFVCPKGLIKPEELDERIGLIYYNEETGQLHTRRKALFRPIEVDANMLMYIIMNKLDNERIPFYTTKQEYCEDYLLDKSYSESVGKAVGIKLKEEMQSMIRKVGKLERQLEEVEHTNKLLNDIISKLRDKGYNANKWNLLDVVTKLLNDETKAPTDIAGLIKISQDLQNYIRLQNTKTI